jgi:hypothetical protein
LQFSLQVAIPETFGYTLVLPLVHVVEVVDWIHLAQDIVQRRTLVNTVMTLRVPHERRGIS